MKEPLAHMWNWLRSLTALAAICTALPAWAEGAAVTYAGDIAAVLNKHCALR